MFEQVAKPLWPFVAASGLTFYLVSKMQDAGVKCEWTFVECCHAGVDDVFAADEWKNDPRNPYAAQIAKESHAAHH